MPFTIAEFHDLVELLEQHPGWRAELRRLLISEDLLNLPETVRELAAMQRAMIEQSRESARRLGNLEQTSTETRTDISEIGERLVRVEDRLVRVEEAVVGPGSRLALVEEAVVGPGSRLALVEEAVVGPGSRLALVEEAVVGPGSRLGRLEIRFTHMQRDLSDIKGQSLEERFRRRPLLFDHLVSNPHVLSDEELDRLLRELHQAGALNQAEMQRLARTDLVVRGGAEPPQWLVVEVSWSVDEDDVERAIDRAALLHKAVGNARPTVAGIRIRAGALESASRHDVAVLVDDETPEPELSFG